MLQRRADDAAEDRGSLLHSVLLAFLVAGWPAAGGCGWRPRLLLCSVNCVRFVTLVPWPMGELPIGKVPSYG
jgi:hypothetical protein